MDSHSTLTAHCFDPSSAAPELWRDFHGTGTPVGEGSVSIHTFTCAFVPREAYLSLHALEG